MLMCLHEYDVGLCYITPKNAALSFIMVGHPCSRYTKRCITSNNQLLPEFKWATLIYDFNS